MKHKAKENPLSAKPKQTRQHDLLICENDAPEGVRGFIAAK